MNDATILIHAIQYAFWAIIALIAFSSVFVIVVVAGGEYRHRKHQQRRAEKRAEKEMEAWDNMLSNGTFHYKVADIVDEYHKTQAYIHGRNINE